MILNALDFLEDVHPGYESTYWRCAELVGDFTEAG